MNKGFGGVQPKMRNSKIVNETYLGLFNHPERLQIGDIQSMQYSEDDTGPFYLTPEEREQRKLDHISNTDKEKKKYTRSQLIKVIKQKSPLTKPRGNLKEIQDLCVQLNIPIEFERNKVVEGWVGKQKGMLQILWERGFIDTSLSKKEILKNIQ